MKIHYFQEGIKDDSFDPVKTTILVDRLKFQDFNSVMNLYANFKCTQKNDIVPQGRTTNGISTLNRDVAVAAKASAGPAVAVDVVVTGVPAGLFLKRKLTR